MYGSGLGEPDPIARQVLTRVTERLSFRHILPLSAELAADMLLMAPDEVHIIMDYVADQIIFGADFYVPGKTWTDVERHEEVEVPDGWWAAFKLELFPAWARKRWPPRMRTICTSHTERTTHVCPHLRVDTAGRRKDLHVMWATTSRGELEAAFHELGALAGRVAEDEWVELHRRFRLLVEQAKKGGDVKA